MKIILSRKGFDSGYGGCASPIFPDETMASLPIPDSEEKKQSLQNLQCNGRNLGDVAKHLIKSVNASNPLGKCQMVHVDPDLRHCDETGFTGYRQAFGQDGAAQSHLSNQLVGVGDLFLFFGWFRRVEGCGENWSFVSGAPDLHVLFGWLQIGEILAVSDHPKWCAKYPWLEDHPHIRHAGRYPPNNTIYLASENMLIDGKKTKYPGGGAFRTFTPAQQLTDPTQTKSIKRSTWLLPNWFAQRDEKGNQLLTYHRNPKRWFFDEKDSTKARLQTVAKGQEFVLNMNDKSLQETNAWLHQLLASQHYLVASYS